MSKGSARRPRQVSREEEALRWLLYEKQISFSEFEVRYKQLAREGKIHRSGKVSTDG